MGIGGVILNHVINVIKNKRVFYIFILVCYFIIFDFKAYGYTDVNLYEEKLIFSDDGTLIMTTHDKKATTNIKYQTIGWVIKRYDMPKDAIGQQYVIISAENEVEYRDDLNDSDYVYCYYYGNKENIANEINSKSTEWKNLLYKYGDYVYIDEIMTVVEAGVRCGGLNKDGTSYGEVYYDYDGIANARAWASKENLRTHYDKSVYFPQQITEKVFGYSYTVLEKISKSHSPNYVISLGEGTKYKSTYDIEMGVPTGSDLYINGYGENIAYNISFIKANVNLRIPIKLIIRYTLKWKAYDGTVKTEIKDVVSWYYVNRRGTYYIIDEIDIDYLSKITVNNYAFDTGYISRDITDCKPKIVKYHASEYYNHIISPVYKDVYYVDGGEICQMTQNGIKPNIPDVNRQSVAESFVGECEVMNDYLSINGRVILDNEPIEKEAKEPLNSIYSSVKGIYFSGFTIPHTKLNKSDNESTGYLLYKDYYTNKTTSYKLEGLKNVSIHTPICISGKVLRTDEGGFKILADMSGEHRAIKGYGYNNYEEMCEKICIKFSEDVIKNGENISKNTWIEWNENDKYELGMEIDYNSVLVNMVAVSKNNIALLEDWEAYIQENANLDISNYGAYTTFNLASNETIKENKKEDRNEVVGTH